jgi:hypothetical protein
MHNPTWRPSFIKSNWKSLQPHFFSVQFEPHFRFTNLGSLCADFLHLPRLSPPYGPSPSYFNLWVLRCQTSVELPSKSYLSLNEQHVIFRPPHFTTAYPTRNMTHNCSASDYLTARGKGFLAIRLSFTLPSGCYIYIEYVLSPHRARQIYRTPRYALTAAVLRSA